MARQCLATKGARMGAAAAAAAAYPDLGRMSHGELIVECARLRGKCADRNATVKAVRAERDAERSRADAAESRANRSAKECSKLAKKVENQRKALAAANDENRDLVKEMKGMVERFKEVTGNFAEMKKSEKRFRAMAIGAKPSRKKKGKGKAAKAAPKRKGAGGRRSPARRKKSGGRGGANRVQGEADETYEVDMENCPDCGEDLSGVVDEYTRRTLELEPIRQKIIDYVVKRRRCPKCGKICTPPVPNTVPGSPLDLATHMFAVCMRLLGLSFGKIHFVMSVLLGIALVGSRSTVKKMIRRIAKLLGPAYKQLKGDLLKERNIHGDETGWRVDGENWWLWAFIGKWVAYFVIDPSRGSAVPMRVLRGYDGNVTSDSWPPWDHVGKTHQKCHVHYIRWIDERLEYGSPGREYRLFARTLKKILRDSQDAAGRRMSKKAKAECIRRLDRRIERLIGKSYSEKWCLQMVKRLKREKSMLFTFILTDTDPDNNHAERPLRVPVSVREMIGCNRTGEGAEDYAVLLSVDTSAKMKGSHIYKFGMENLGNVGRATLKRIK